jgi:hypothetical protein
MVLCMASTIEVPLDMPKRRVNSGRVSRVEATDSLIVQITACEWHISKNAYWCGGAIESEVGAVHDCQLVAAASNPAARRMNGERLTIGSHGQHLKSRGLNA